MVAPAKKKILAATLVSLAVSLLPSVPTVARPSAKKEQSEAISEPSEVIVLPVSFEMIFETRVYGGFIEAAETRPAAPEVAGTVDEIKVRPGQQVNKDTLLYLVKPRGLANEFQHHRVYSPLKGIVSNQLMEVGAYVQPGDVVMQIADPNRLTIRFDAALQDVLHLKPGIKGEVRISEPGSFEAQPSKTLGTITAVSPASHPELRTYQVYMDLTCTKQCPEAFRIGAFARVVIKENERSGVKIAKEFLHGDGSSVFIVEKDDTLKRLNVKTGKTDGINVEILEGLAPGMSLVTSHSGDLKDGGKVTVKQIDEERQKLLDNGTSSKEL